MSENSVPSNIEERVNSSSEAELNAENTAEDIAITHHDMSISNGNSEQSLISEKIRSRPPAVPPRVPSRGYNAHLRASRATSLIIPVVTHDDDNDDDDYNKDDNDDYNDDNAIGDGKIVDLDVEISETSPPTSPKLPNRPPKTPVRRNTAEFQPQVLSTYGMERISGQNFSPTSMRSTRSRKSSFRDSVSSMDVPSFSLKTQQFLIQSRKSQVDQIVELLSNAELTISSNEYMEKIHSSDIMIETISRIRAGDYDSTNLPILYSLLLKSIKIAETEFNSSPELNKELVNKIDEVMGDLSFLLRSTNDQKAQLRNDLMKVYSLLSLTYENNGTNGGNEGNNNIVVPNALILSFLYRCGSKYVLPQTLILALLFSEFITPSGAESNEFKFLLLRTLESVDPRLLLKTSDESSNPISYVNNLLNSNKFWCDLVHQLYINDTTKRNHAYGLTKVLHNIVVYGIFSLIEVIVNLRHELEIFGCNKLNKPEKDIDESGAEVIPQPYNLINFHREYRILNESADSQLTGNTLEKLSLKNEELENILKEHHKGYNELLNNYKQLNEEKISVAGMISKFQNENETLQATKRSLSAQVDQALSQYDVIKQTMEKNKRVQELNDSMTKEIERLTIENKRLRK